MRQCNICFDLYKELRWVEKMNCLMCEGCYKYWKKGRGED